MALLVISRDMDPEPFARLLKQLAPEKGALFGRYIGSSFAVGVADIDSRALGALGERIRNAVYELGVKHEDSKTAALLKQAAVAMFKGKKKGRNCVVNG